MESKNEVKEIDIKNCTCWYFDDIMRDADVYSGNNLLTKNKKNVRKYFNLRHFIQNFYVFNTIAY